MKHYFKFRIETSNLYMVDTMSGIQNRQRQLMHSWWMNTGITSYNTQSILIFKITVIRNLINPNSHSSRYDYPLRGRLYFLCWRHKQTINQNAVWNVGEYGKGDIRILRNAYWRWRGVGPSVMWSIWSSSNQKDLRRNSITYYLNGPLGDRYHYR